MRKTTATMSEAPGEAEQQEDFADTLDETVSVLYQRGDVSPAPGGEAVTAA